MTFPVAYTKGTEFKPPPAVRPSRSPTSIDGASQRPASEDGGVNFEDGLGVVAEVDIEAAPRKVWPFISDIEFPVDASEELQGAAWNGEARGLGATFTGHNKLGDMEWSIENHVTDYVEGRASSGAQSTRRVQADVGGSRSWTRASEVGCGSRWRSAPRTT